MDLTTFITWLSDFPYWGEVFTFLISLLLAWATARFTSRSENLKLCREKRMEVYDETLTFLDELRMNPEIALTDDFYTESLKISNHLRAYGSKEVVKALRDAIMTLRKEKKECDSAIGELYERYMPCETIYDEEGKPIGEEPTPRIDMGEFEELLEMEKRKRVLPGRKMLELLSPAFESINKSIVTGRG